MAKGNCSYCRTRKNTLDSTHRITTCPQRKTDRENWINENKEWAINFKKSMKKCGYGIGAIITFNQAKMPYLVEGIRFDELSKDMMRSAYSVIPMDKLAEEDDWWYKYCIGFPNDDLGVDQIQVLSAIDPEIVDRQFPADWETGVYGVPYYLRDQARRKRVKS